jgi:hypothetical protein
MAEQLVGDYRKFVDKNYLGSWDVPDGEDLVLTIAKVTREEVKNERGAENKIILHFAEKDYKPMILNKRENPERISKALGTTRAEEWVGKRIAITTEKVSAFGGTTDALRVRPYPPKVTEVFCEDCGQAVTKHGDYSVNKIVTMSRAKYGTDLCWECALKRKEAADVDG